MDKERNLPPATFFNEWVEVRKSTIPGYDMWGLFAKKDIPANCVISLYKGIEMTLKEFKDKYGTDIKYSYSLRQINKRISGKEKEFLTENPCHYCNESLNPNVSRKKRCLISNKFIVKDAELFIDYPKNYPRDYNL